jgi:hypothetical protein
MLGLANWSAPARAANDGGMVAVGSSLGVSYIKPQHGDGVTLVAIPNGANFVSATPGFRVASVSPGRGFEFGIDMSLLYGSSNGASFHDVTVGLDAAGFTAPRSDTSPYFGVEAGMRNLDFFGSGTQPYFGVGLGVRHVVVSDHGAVKFGVGFRRFFENTNDGLPSLTVIDVKMAFDLWIPR